MEFYEEFNNGISGSCLFDCNDSCDEKCDNCDNCDSCDSRCDFDGCSIDNDGPSCDALTGGCSSDYDRDDSCYSDHGCYRD